MRQLSEGLRREKNRLESTGAWVELVALQMNDAGDMLRVCNQATNVEFRGHTYFASGVSRDQLKEDSEGDLTSLRVGIANVSSEIEEFMEAYEGFRNQPCTLYLVHTDHLDGGDAAWELHYVVEDSEINDSVAFVTLGHANPQKQPILDRFIRSRCRWRYKSRECGYTGSLATCDLSLAGTNGCTVHGDDEVANGQRRKHPQRFGGFPGIPRA